MKNLRKNLRIEHIRSLAKKENVFLLFLLLYAIGGIILLKFYQYQINPDAISYISLAKQYLAGDFANAINGYWSPLFSWLLAPLLVFGLEPILTAKVLLLVFGGLALYAIKLLCERLKISFLISSVTLLLSVINLLYFSLTVITPDIISVTLLLYLSYFIFDIKYFEKKYYPLFCGVLGAFSYFAKTYNFFFFIVFFFTTNVIYFFIQSDNKEKKKESRKRIIKALVTGMLVFIALSSFWIGLISNKYSKFAIGTSSSNNKAAEAVQSKTNPATVGGLISPPNEKAVSAWEDPSYFEFERWSMFDSWENFKHQIKSAFSNLKLSLLIYRRYNYFLPLTTIIFAIFLLWSLKTFFSNEKNAEVLILALTALLYASGYILFMVEERYIWLTILLSIVMVGYLLTKIFLKKNIFVNSILLLVFIASFSIYPIKTIRKNLNTGENVYSLAQTLKTNYGISGNIAVNNGNRRTGLYISYYLESKFFGEVKKNIASEQIEEDLLKHKIDYFLDLKGSKYKFTKYQEITGETSSQLQVYALSNQ